MLDKNFVLTYLSIRNLQFSDWLNYCYGEIPRHVPCRMSISRNDPVTLSKLRVRDTQVGAR